MAARHERGTGTRAGQPYAKAGQGLTRVGAKTGEGALNSNSRNNIERQPLARHVRFSGLEAKVMAPSIHTEVPLESPAKKTEQSETLVGGPESRSNASESGALRQGGSGTGFIPIVRARVQPHGGNFPPSRFSDFAGHQPVDTYHSDGTYCPTG